MPDPILDEIWRVREQLVKQHGGIHGYVRYVQELDLSRRRRERLKKAKKGRSQRSKKSP